MTAEIHDRGYRRYDGERTGLPGATKTLLTHSIQRSLGLHRKARHKIIPFTLIIVAFVPAIIYIGLAALLPQEIAAEFAPPFSAYFGLVSTMLFLFVSFVAPDLLCQDRRSGMLGIYLASPLDRSTYLMAKTLAISILMLAIALLPNLLYLIAVSLQGWGPGGIVDSLEVVLRMVLASMVISTFFASIGMAVASTTDRKGTATAITLGVFVGSTAIAGTLTEGLGYSSHLRLLTMIGLPIRMAPRIFGETGDWTTAENPTWTMWLTIIGVIVACHTFVWYRYHKMLVRR